MPIANWPGMPHLKAGRSGNHNGANGNGPGGNSTPIHQVASTADASHKATTSITTSIRNLWNMGGVWTAISLSAAGVMWNAIDYGNKTSQNVSELRKDTEQLRKDVAPMGRRITACRESREHIRSTQQHVETLQRHVETLQRQLQEHEQQRLERQLQLLQQHNELLAHRLTKVEPVLISLDLLLPERTSTSRAGGTVK